MNPAVLALYNEYLQETGDKAAAAALSLADAMLQQPEALPAEGMLNIRQAASYLGCTEHGVRKIVTCTQRSREGQHISGPTIEFFQGRKKGTILFRREWLDDFIERHHLRAGTPKLPTLRHRQSPEGGQSDITKKAAEWKAMCQ